MVWRPRTSTLLCLLITALVPFFSLPAMAAQELSQTQGIPPGPDPDDPTPPEPPTDPDEGEPAPEPTPEPPQEPEPTPEPPTDPDEGEPAPEPTPEPPQEPEPTPEPPQDPDQPAPPDDGSGDPPQDPEQPDNPTPPDDGDNETPTDPDQPGDGDEEQPPQEPDQPDEGEEDSPGEEEPDQPDEGEEDEEENPDEPDDQPDQGDNDDDEDREWTSELKPVFNLNLDWWEKIINQTPHDPEYSRPELVEHDYSPERDTLVVWDYRNGFEVTQYHKIGVDLGAVNRWYYKNATDIEDHIWAQIGLVATLGEEMSFTRYADTMDEAKNLTRLLAPPRFAEQVDHWKQGEHLTYVAHGGLVFRAGAGVGPIGVGSTVVAQGSWKTFIQKLEGNHVYLKISHAELQSLGLYANARLVGIDVTYFNHEDDGFSFTLDLNTETGRRAFHDAVGGNLSPIQRMALDPRRPEVQLVDTFLVTSNGWFSRFFFGLPFLGTTWSKGKIYSFSRSNLFIDDSEIQVHYGLFMKNRDTQVIGIRRGRTEAFYGGHYHVDRPDGDEPQTEDIQTHNFAKYVFHAYNNEATHWRLRMAMKEIIRKTGLPEDILLNIPSLEDFNYTGVFFELGLSEAQAHQLMQIPDNYTLSEFRELGRQRLYTYFSYSGDPYDICADHGWDHNRCYREKNHEIMVGFARMYQALVRMAQTQDTNRKEFVKAYAEFGQGMITNLFSMRTIFDLAGSHIEGSYFIEGEKLSKYRKSLTLGPEAQSWRVTPNETKTSSPRLRIRVGH